MDSETTRSLSLSSCTDQELLAEVGYRFAVTRGGNSLVSPTVDSAPTEHVKKVLPEGKRVVRTKSSGDRVYYIDEEKKTRQWITNPDVLTSLGFGMEDVTDVEDAELLKYQMAAALYKAVNAA